MREGLGETSATPELWAAGAADGTFKEQVNNCRMFRGIPEGALETERSREVVQAEAAAWTQPGERAATLSVRKPACPKGWRMLARVLQNVGLALLGQTGGGGGLGVQYK